MKNYSTRDINLNFIIKVYGWKNGEKINKAVGVSGLIDLIGEQLAEKFVARTFAGKGDVLHCKQYGGLRVSFYLH